MWDHLALYEVYELCEVYCSLTVAVAKLEGYLLIVRDLGMQIAVKRTFV